MASIFDTIRQNWEKFQKSLSDDKGFVQKGSLTLQPARQAIQNWAAQPQNYKIASVPNTVLNTNFMPGQKMPISQAVSKIATNLPSEMQRFGNILRGTSDFYGNKPKLSVANVPVLGSIAGMAGNTGQTIGQGAMRYAQGIGQMGLGIKNKNNLQFGKGALNTLYGGANIYMGGNVASPAGKVFQLANFTSNLPINDVPVANIASRFSRGVLQGQTGIQGLSPHVTERNKVNFFGQQVDPIMGAGSMVGFVNNPVNKKFFELTNKLLPSEGVPIKKFLVYTGLRGGLENIAMNIDKLPDNPTDEEALKYLITEGLTGAGMEYGGQIMNKALSKAAGPFVRMLKKPEMIEVESFPGTKKYIQVTRGQKILMDLDNAINKTGGLIKKADKVVKNVLKDERGFIDLSAEIGKRKGKIEEMKAPGIASEDPFVRNLANQFRIKGKNTFDESKIPQVEYFVRKLGKERVNQIYKEVGGPKNEMGWIEKFWTKVKTEVPNWRTEWNEANRTLVEGAPAMVKPPQGGVEAPKPLANKKTIINLGNESKELPSGYVYRGLSENELNSILTNKRLVGQAKNIKMGDALTDRFTYVDPLESEAKAYAEINNGQVVRIKTENHTFQLDKEDSFSNAILSGKDKLPSNISELPSLRTSDPISIDDIEIKKNGKWIPLSNLQSQQTPPTTTFRSTEGFTGSSRTSNENPLSGGVKKPLEQEIQEFGTIHPKKETVIGPAAEKAATNLKTQGNSIVDRITEGIKKFKITEEQWTRYVENPDTAPPQLQNLIKAHQELVRTGRILHENPNIGEIQSYFPHMDKTTMDMPSELKNVGKDLWVSEFNLGLGTTKKRTGALTDYSTEYNKVMKNYIEQVAIGKYGSRINATPETTAFVKKVNTHLTPEPDGTYKPPTDDFDYVGESSIKNKVEDKKPIFSKVELSDTFDSLKRKIANEGGEGVKLARTMEDVRDMRDFSKGTLLNMEKMDTKQKIAYLGKRLTYLTNKTALKESLLRMTNGGKNELPDSLVLSLLKAEKDYRVQNFVDEVGKYKFGKETQKYLNTEIDRLMKYSRYEQTMLDKISNFVTGMFYRAQVWGNINTAVQQKTESFRIPALYDKDVIGAGLKQALEDRKIGADILKRYDFSDVETNISKQLGVTEKKGLTEKLDESLLGKAGNLMVNVAENSKNRDFLYAAEAQGKKLGLQGDDLYRFVRNELFANGFILHEFNTPKMMKNPLVRLGLQYWQYQIKAYNRTVELAQEGETKKALGLVGSQVAAAVFMAVLTGKSLDKIYETFKLRGGPAVSLAIDSATLLKELYDAETKERLTGSSADKKREKVTKKLSTMALRNTIPFANQIYKTGDAAKVLSQGYDTDIYGNVTYKAPTDPISTVQGLMFGKSSFKTNRNFYKPTNAGGEGGISLGKDQSARVKALGSEQINKELGTRYKDDALRLYFSGNKDKALELVKKYDIKVTNKEASNFAKKQIADEYFNGDPEKARTMAQEMKITVTNKDMKAAAKEKAIQLILEGRKDEAYQLYKRFGFKLTNKDVYGE